MGIYEQMENNWKTYCLMSGIALIEEFSKPKECYKRIIKNDKIITYNGLSAIRLKVKSYDIIKTWWKITRKWEQEMNMNFLGRKSKNGPIPEKSSGQWLIFFTPLWIFQILKTTGELPSKYATECYMKTVKSITERKSGRPLKYIISKKEITIIEDKNSEFKILMRNKNLARGAFIVSFDLEFKGVQFSIPCLCMTTRYEDFLEFMLKVAKKWGWNTSTNLSKVDINHSLKRGIKATPKKEFRLTINSLKDIYLSGPLTDKNKDMFLRFQLQRMSNNNSNKKLRADGLTKNIIFNELKYGPKCSTALMLKAGVRVDVVLGHLNTLEREGLINKERKGKHYLWSLNGETNATKCNI